MGGEMKLIKFDLSIDGVKVKDINELRDHFTPEILAHYRSGVLAKWLMTRKYQDELTALASLEDGDDHSLLKALCHVFQIDADECVIAEALREVRPAAVVAMSSQENSRLKFALSINGKRVSRLDDLRANFTIEVLDHYRNGLLSEWLHSHGLTQELAAIDALDESDDHLLVKSLSRIFAVVADDRLIAEALKTGSQIMQLEPCPGTTWIEPLSGMVFVWIPSGCSRMSNRFANFDNNFIPVHMSGFWLGQRTVTYDQWKEALGQQYSEERHCRGDESIKLNSKRDPRLFIDALNAKSNGESGFRLPTLTELVYAVCGDSDWIFNPPITLNNQRHPWGLHVYQFHDGCEFVMDDFWLEICPRNLERLNFAFRKLNKPNGYGNFRVICESSAG